MPPSAPTGQRAAASFSLGEEGNTTVDIVIQPAYQQLEAEGCAISRRTVAKYRDELGIPSASGRKEIH